MAKKDENKAAKGTPKKPASHDDEVMGKAYDSRLMARLLRYLKPYRGETILSAFSILLKSGSDVLGPFLVKVAVDNYMSATKPANPSWIARHLSPVPMVGVAQCAGLYMASLLLSYGLEFL